VAVPSKWLISQEAKNPVYRQLKRAWHGLAPRPTKFIIMITAIRRQLLTNWHPMRWVALAIGLFLGYNWLAESSPVLGFMSLFFLFQAITNTGCLAGQCASSTPVTPATDELNTDKIQFEEIKNRP
jgi:hypothetical protein